MPETSKLGHFRVNIFLFLFFLYVSKSTYVEYEMARWCHFASAHQVCPLARSHSLFQPSHQPLVSPHHWRFGPTSGAFIKKKLSQRAHKQMQCCCDFQTHDAVLQWVGTQTHCVSEIRRTSGAYENFFSTKS